LIGLPANDAEFFKNAEEIAAEIPDTAFQRAWG
jgi:hypothetical protein